MELHYKKNNNNTLFGQFKKDSLLNITSPQSYIPLYSTFFSLNETNYNSINLNHTFSISDLNKKITENVFEATIQDISGNLETSKTKKEIFFKLSPLFDPIKFMIGKYQNQEGMLTLPNFNEKHPHKKLDDPNNSAYVDGFFSYLTSRLLHTHKFTHGIDFYGSFLGVKKNYKINIADDIEYLQESTHFNKYNNVELNNITYSIDDYFLPDVDNLSRKKKEKIKLEQSDVSDNVVIELSDINDIQELDTIFKTSSDTNESSKCNSDIDLLFEYKTKNKKEKSSDKADNSSSSGTTSSGSSCSSRTSNTCSLDNDSCVGSNSCSDVSDDNDESDNDSCSSSNTNSSGSSYTSYSSNTEEEVIVNISEFPVQIISLEKCDNTLDHHICNNKISDEEWDSIVIQILMILITYQKVFDFTHNDLHTNNIMYIATDKQFLSYRFKGKYYKIPTFGKIYKIIDFGRAIYRFNGQILCSDSFHNSGDAATQYNCEPYLNKNKPVIPPNKSFDLCRLGGSLFDFIVDELEECDEILSIKDIEHIKSPIKKIILEWCKDDKGRNIIYKNNGDERYPEFKLYKMIARTVHNHIPEKVLEKDYFDKYIVSKKKVNSKKLLDIDSYPVYT